MVIGAYKCVDHFVDFDTIVYTAVSTWKLTEQNIDVTEFPRGNFSKSI